MKLKTVIHFKVEVLETWGVNCFVQDCTASVNSKGEVRPLIDAQTTRPTAAPGELKELSAHALDYIHANEYKTQRSLCQGQPGTERKKEARYCGCAQACGQSQRPRPWLVFLPERPTGLMASRRLKTIFLKGSWALLAQAPGRHQQGRHTSRRPGKQYWTWGAPIKS